MDLPQAVSKLKTKKTGAEKKYQSAVPDEAAGGQQHCRCCMLASGRQGQRSKRKGVNVRASQMERESWTSI